MAFQTNGMNGHGGTETLQWKLGLVNNHGKYLTAETFGFKINASGTSLRKKQMWIVEHDASQEEIVYIKSHLGRYLSGDKKGNVTCDAESKGKNEKFILSYHPSGDGRWSFQNQETKLFFGGADDVLQCDAKAAGDSEWWTVRLGIHPQVNMKSVARKKYASYNPEAGEIQFKEIIPWGEDALITIQFKKNENSAKGDGKYVVRTCDNKFLCCDGSLSDSCNPKSLFTLEIKSGQYSGMALKDCSGKYMTAVGQFGKMQSRDKSAKQDIVFNIEDSHPQAFITAHNGKRVSTKQGVDLSANQPNDELSDTETFQIEFDKTSKKWRVRTAENKYWSLEAASGIQAVGNGLSGTGLFDLEWKPDGHVAIQACNGKYVTAKLNGSLNATSEFPDDKELFFITIRNRPLLILRCDYGYVGFKTAANPRIECNKSTSTDNIIYLEHTNGASGEYFMKGINGNYWTVGADGMVNADGSSNKTPFLLELEGQSRMLIRVSPNSTNRPNMYIKGEQNGIFNANVAQPSAATKWEY